ncbi:MAG: phosphoribosylglycinamide formyltransferase [Candidatus Zixiibacteriota bacterium]|nr:MAG: phosphoribosylglycinamide formyltransferase [candidate division Zixibacteria bacterium]
MSEKRPRVAVFISGRGSGFENLHRASRENRLAAEIVWVVSSTRKAAGLEIARGLGIEVSVFRPKKDAPKEAAAEDLLSRLRERSIDYIALAGYLKLLPDLIVREYPGRILNIHPALLPRYGGKGMYGHHVHEAVLASGDRESGATVHLVDAIYDHGRILEQRKVEVREDDTPESLAARVLKVEHELYPIVLQKLIDGEYEISDG